MSARRVSRKPWAFSLAVCMVVWLPGWGHAAAAKQTSWQPKRTWVFAVGILQWKHPDQWASFPDIVKNRADQQLVDFFRKSGVPDEQIIYLKDSQATLKNIRKRFTGMLKQVGEEDLLILYFAGHGWWDSSSNK